MNDYIFTSERLGFRAWRQSDIPVMAAINADEEVMRFFPKTNTVEETATFVNRMQQQLLEKNYCYFAVDQLANQKMIGFIGLSYQTYEAPFTPCIDIGWRLAKHSWGQGFATEGAKACLAYAKTLGIQEIKSIAPLINTPSTHVMQKIGMSKEYTFKHPLLKDYPAIEECVVYGISP